MTRLGLMTWLETRWIANHQFRIGFKYCLDLPKEKWHGINLRLERLESTLLLEEEFQYFKTWALYSHVLVCKSVILPSSRLPQLAAEIHLQCSPLGQLSSRSGYFCHWQAAVVILVAELLRYTSLGSSRSLARGQLLQFLYLDGWNQSSNEPWLLVGSSSRSTHSHS